MVVELFGVPGSGKSTVVALAAAQIKFLSRHDISDQWKRQPRLRRIASLAGYHARVSRLWAVLGFAVNARITRTDSLRRLSRILAKSCRLRSTQDAVVLDQGLLQELWSILYAARKIDVDPAFAAPLIKALYDGIDAKIIYLEIQPEIAAERISGRAQGHSRLDGLDVAQIHDGLADTAALPGCLVEAARLAGLPVQSIDGSMPSGRIAAAIIAAVEQ